MRRYVTIIFVFTVIVYVSAVILVSCNVNGEEELISNWLEKNEQFSGGQATVNDVSVNAFGNPAPNLQGDGDLVFITGNSFFNRNWVTAPASTEDLDGLGPLYNARSCSGCHFKDGRGRPPIDGDEPMISLLFRLSKPGIDQNGGPLPEETYGLQLSTQAVLGIKPEGDVQIKSEIINGNFADGTPYTLSKPVYHFINPAYGDFQADMLFSPRVAPQMVGLGLLAAIDEDTILQFADPDDENHDGISGRANFVWDQVNNTTSLGRFGWKANQPSLLQQTAGAFLGDIGLTTSVFPQENCSPFQTDCLNTQNGGQPEVKESILQKVAFYASTLAVPKRRDWDDPTVLQGKQLFFEANCSACHVSKITTGTSGAIPEFYNQTIWPYTDMLLHDMGEMLADNRSDYLATGKEWRTPPLWGIGLIETVNGHTNFLHDGRARNLEEAILWHDGEGKDAKEAFVNMSLEQRTALIKFLQSL